MSSILYVLLISSFIPFGVPMIVPKLLLPYYEQIQVNYTINAEEGCFKWHSQNSDVASIEPIPKGSKSCTQSAIVFVQSKTPSRRITLILAENEVTGTILQCDVIIDQIDSIDIVSRTRELYLDDPPETLNIRALDEEGNTFSSTAYMLFNWKLLPDEDEDNPQGIPPHKILQIGKFIETDYTAEPYVEELEALGLQSDTILLSGVQTGTAYVMAKLSSTKEIVTAKIGIVVRDKVFLIPNGVVLLPKYGIIQYQVEKWRNGKPTEVKMPHEQYFLELSTVPDGEIVAVSLDTSTSTVVALELGNMQLFLMDRNLKKDTVQDESDIHVVEPAYIRFSIQPDERWVLETGRYYIIMVNMFDANNQKMYPCSNIRIGTIIDPDYFDVLQSTTNGTWHRVRTLQKGHTELYAELTGIMKQNGYMETFIPVIDTTQEVDIFDPIKVRPPIIAFPFMPKPTYFKYRARATGGSGNYTWSIDNDTFAIVSKTGVVSTKTGPEQEEVHELATAILKATDVRNPAHWGTAIVMLVLIDDMLFAPSHREAEIGQYLDLYITMLARVNEVLVPISDCRAAGVKWKIQDMSVFEDVPGYEVEIPDIEGTIACTGRRLKALREGFTVLVARYDQVLENGLDDMCEASTTIVGYPPLKSIDPISSAVVSLDSSKLLIFKGGPIRWPLWHSGHEREAHATNDSVVELTTIKNPHQEHHVIARCLNLGHTQVILKVFNRPCNTNPWPVTASVAVRMYCTTPHHLELKVSSLLPSCPLHNTEVIQTVAVMDNAFSVNLTVYDDFGYVFDNFSSIYSEWSSNVEDTEFVKEISVFTPVDATVQKKHIVTKSLKLSFIEGEQIITVSLTKYKDDTSYEICREYDCTRLDPIVTGTVGLLVVSPPVLMPTVVVLYNHENFTESVKVIGGSGHYDYRLIQQVNVTMILETLNSKIKLVPLRSGTSVLEVEDLCLADVPTAKANVIVIEVGRLVLKAPPRMELGRTVELSVEVEDNFGNAIPTKYVNYIHLEVVSSAKDVIAFTSITPADNESFVALSNITGTAVGATMLTAVSKLRDGHVVRSNAIHIMVVSPLELYPPVITLIRHAEFQLRTIGGPRADFTMKFLVVEEADQDIVEVSQCGVVHAYNLGTTMVTAQAIMHDGTVFYCKNPTVVRVVQLAGIRIDSPLTQYHVGGIIPLHVNGLDDDLNPMSFGSVNPGLIFTWESGNPSVVKLRTVHSKAGIETSDRLSFTMLAEGMSAGHCVVTVTVTAEDETVHQLVEREYTAEISLMIYEPLAIVSTESCVRKQWKSTSNFLITPSTSHNLETNRDGVARTVDFEVLSRMQCTIEVLDSMDDDTDPCITVDDKGVITSSPNQCEDTLLITAVERFGINQTMALHVLVRPVAYVIARAATHFRTRDNVPLSYAFPLGAAVHFVVDQFDDSADKFDATSHDVLLDLNRYDRVEIQPESGNRSFHLRLPIEGTTIMSVASYLASATTPSSVYFFPVNVLGAVQPEEYELTVGLRFCFFSEFINLNGSDGSWKAANPKFLVESTTGAVVAVGRGDTELTYVVDSFKANVKVSTAPFVAKLDDFRLSGPILSKFTSYVLPIRMQPEYEGFDPLKCRGLESEMQDLAAGLFVCSVRFSNSNIEDIYSVQSEYLPKLGSYACVVGRRELSDDDRKALAVVDDRLVISVDVKSRHLGIIENGVTLVPFLPSFVAHVSSNTLAVGSYVILCIHATPEVNSSIKIIPCDPSDLVFETDRSSDTAAYCYRVYTYSRDITLRSAYFRLVSHLTEQDEKFDLMIDRVPGRLMSTPSQCSSIDRTMWKGASDIMTDTYLAYLTTFAVILISTALLLAAFTAYRWVSNNSARPSTSFTSQSPPPYDPGAGTPIRSPGSPPKVRLWSRYYQPQQASPSSG